MENMNVIIKNFYLKTLSSVTNLMKKVIEMINGEERSKFTRG